MTLNKHIERIIAAAGIAGTLAFGTWAGQAIAHADTPRDDSSVTTTNLTDVSDTWWYTVDQIPVCAEEDCSDQPGQIGFWVDPDTDNTWLSTGESSVLVVDDTAR